MSSSVGEAETVPLDADFLSPRIHVQELGGHLESSLPWCAFPLFLKP